MIKKNWKKVCFIIFICILLGTQLIGVKGHDSRNQVLNHDISNEKNKKNKYEGRIVIWGWDDSIKKSFYDFNQIFPNIKIDFVYVKKSEYLQKFQTALAAGTEIPDIVLMEEQNRGAFLALDMWENLEKPPYNFNKDLIFDYGIFNLKNFKNEIVAVPYDIPAAGLAYRRELAKQYFGTDDAKELQELFSDWNKFIEKGKEVKAKSNGKVYMFASLNDIGVIISNQHSEPYVVNKKFNVEENFDEIFEWLVKMRDADIVDKKQLWSPSWYSTFSKEICIFYPCPTWFPRYVIKPNELYGKGKWGLMIPPKGGFAWGGTAWAIPKKSKNKEIAWKYIEWLLLSEKGATICREKHSSMMNSYKNAYKDSEFVSIKEPSFGNQDIGNVFFYQIFPKIKARPVGEYDTIIIDTFSLITTALSRNSTMTSNDAIKKFKEEIKINVPEIIVE
jgi:multiple sugar transport system substrate-binding protein